MLIIYTIIWNIIYLRTIICEMKRQTCEIVLKGPELQTISRKGEQKVEQHKPPVHFEADTVSVFMTCI